METVFETPRLHLCRPLPGEWHDIIDLDQYMASGDWQKDYEADERGELRKDIPKDVVAGCVVQCPATSGQCTEGYAPSGAPL